MKALLVLALVSCLVSPPTRIYTIHIPAAFVSSNEIAWLDVEKLLANCQIKTVFQFHSLRINLIMADESQMYTTQPRIDAIIETIEQVDPPCVVLVATE